MTSITRRSLVANLGGCSLGIAAAAVAPSQSLNAKAASGRKTSFLEIIRQPDSLVAYSGLDAPRSLSRSAAKWSCPGTTIHVDVRQHEFDVSITAPESRPTHVHLRWAIPVTEGLSILGDAWERSYGDLRWSGMIPERIMPWYFLAGDAHSLHGYGVKTGAAALCFWQVDTSGVSLWLNVCNGGEGVELGERELLAATVITRRGEFGEEPMTAARAFCGQMCSVPRRSSPIYGSNDWYYAYGNNSATQIVRDAELVASLSPSGGPRPFTIIDDGWQNKDRFPDMHALAESIRERKVRPGLWIRPMQAAADTDSKLLLPRQRFGRTYQQYSAPAYDPTTPEALDIVLRKVSQAVGWTYELIKHDFSTYELFGRWGFEMSGQPTVPGWNFHDRTRTNAEIVRDLYLAIRRKAGESTVLIGCNTIGHLAAGLFDAQRTGDDVSGKNWERTRRMGVNTLANRLPQHHAFFLLDADCVPITTSTPWRCNRQWLDLIARSGTVLLVSAEAAAMGDEQRQAIRESFALAASASDPAAPLDWRENTTPETWNFRTREQAGDIVHKYDWCQDTGAWPFEI
jgi:alpha-galactosidase